MRIALDATYSVDKTPTGIAVYSREILNGLAVAHPEHTFIHCYRPKQYRHAPDATLPNVVNRTLLPYVGSLLSRPDVFHALNQRMDRRATCKVVTTFHDLFVLTAEYSTPEFRQRFANQARKAASNSDLIIAVSQFTANQVETLLGIPASRIRVVHHGVHLPAVVQAPRRKIVLSVGAIQLRKNTARLVEAFEALPSDWKLVLAGSPTGYGAEKILARVASSSARDRIRLAGYLSTEELQGLYASASIFAFPSLDEGFGMPVLEAMAYGIPVVTSNTSALPEVAGDAALLVDPLDSQALADSLLELAVNPALHKRLTHAGIIRATHFTWQQAVAKTYAAYEDL